MLGSKTNAIKYYSKLPLIPKDSFFRISNIGLIGLPNLKYMALHDANPELYPKCSLLYNEVSPVLIMSSYNNTYRVHPDKWLDLKNIHTLTILNRKRSIFPIFVDTNIDWVKQLKDIFD